MLLRFVASENGVGASPLAAQLKKIRFSVSAVSIAEIPFKIAQVKGFYREEGLNVEVILIRGAVGMQALLGVASAKPQFDLVSQPQIRSIQDLKGNLVGISSRGGSIDLLTQIILQKNGLAPNKDVTSIVVGGQEETVLALKTGRIAAALLSPPRPLILQREGFNRIAYAGDYMPSYPNGGIGVTEEKIKTDPSEVLAFVKASLRGLQFARQNRLEAMKILSDYFAIKDPALSEQFFELYLSRLPVNGSADEPWMRGAIEFTRNSLSGVTKEVAPSQVFDFSFVQKALR